MALLCCPYEPMVSSSPIAIGKNLHFFRFFRDITEGSEYTGQTARFASHPASRQLRQKWYYGRYSYYDLVVLDIFMDELNGVQVAEQLVAKNAGVQIIFCSTSNAYAAESYDVSALRYLIKPVPEEKMFRTLDRLFYAYTALRSLSFKLNRMDEHMYLSEVL